MKKILALVLALAMVATFAACGGDTKDDKKDGSSAADKVTAEYKLGMGTVVNLDSSEDSLAQADTTVATVVTDKDGKIVSCDIDVAQTKVIVEGGVVDVEGTDLRTKTEKGADYGMTAAVNFGMDWNGDGVVKEWFEQAKVFEDYVIGKTADQVKNIKTAEVEGHGYVIAAEDDLLKAGCTIQISEFITAVVNACNDADAKTFTAAEGFKLGLDIDTVIDESTDAADGADANVCLYSDFAATVVDADGKIITSIIDAVQPKVAVSKDGAIGEKTFVNTKRGLKADYGMAAAVNYGMDWNGDGVVKEWFEQAKAFEDYIAGKTADEVKNIKTSEVEGHGYVIAADDALLNAGCTIQISSFMAVTANAIANAD